MKDKNSFTSSPFAIERKLIEDANSIGKQIPHIYAIWEVDITDIRLKIKELKKTKNISFSLSTYLLYCFVQTVNENKNVHACKSWLQKLIKFDHIDVFFPIEIKGSILDPKIIRSANYKSILELEHEIQNTKAKTKIDLDFLKRIFLNLPKFIRNWLYGIIMKNPKLRKDVFGTVYFTSTTFSSDLKLAGIPKPIQSMGVFVGTIHKNIILKDNQTFERESISLTSVCDHNIVDGAILCRFVLKFKANIETQIDKL